MQVLSFQAVARRSQKFKEKPLLLVCINCGFYSSKWVENEWNGTEEKNRRCTLGRFAVKRMSSCDRHQFGSSDAVKI